MTSGATWAISERARNFWEGPWGRTLRTYWGDRTAWERVKGVGTLGEPFWQDVFRINNSAGFRAQIPKDLAYLHERGRVWKPVRRGDQVKYLKWWQKTMRETLEKNPRRGEELAANEGTWRRLATDLGFSSLLWLWPVTPLGATVKYAAPKLVRGVGVPIVRAIERRPTAARWLLSPAKRVAQLGDSELMHLYRQLRGRVGQAGRVREVSAAEVRRRLGGYSGREIEEAALLAQQFENRAGYSAAVRGGRAKAASSNRVLEAAEKIRQLTRKAFRAIPRRTARPGTAEEGRAIARIAGTKKVSGKGRLGAAEAWARTLVWVDRWRGVQKGTTQQSFEWIIARDYPRGIAEYVSDRLGQMPVDLRGFWEARVRAAGGAWDANLVRGVMRDGLEELGKTPGRFEAAGRRALKGGEFRLPDELKVVRKSGKLVGRVDRATGEYVTSYRKAYYPLAGEAKAGVPARPVRAKAGVPGGRRPRRMERPVVARAEREIYDDLTRMVGAEPRYEVLKGIEAQLARAMAKGSALKDPGQRAAAIEVFGELGKRLGAKEARGVFRRALELLDHWGVTTPKKLYTLYNPAWYFKNYIDTVGVKNLLAGIPPAKLHKFLRRMPKDVYGREVDVGVTWTKELTGMEVTTSGFARVGNAIENTGRRALWDDVYQRELRRLTKTGMATDRAHVEANEAAMRMVAKVHFDYGDLSKLDEVMRRIIPFWIYERNQLRWMAEQAVARPRLVYGGFKFFDVGEKGGGPPVRLPGLPTLQVQLLAGLSPVRYIKTISGVLADDERERKRWDRAGPLGKWFQRGEKWGFYAHPFLEQGLSAILKGGDLMSATNWKQVAPLVGAVGKVLKADMTYIGVWRTMFPGEEKAPRIEQLKRGYKRRVLMRHAFSILDGEEWGVARCEKYVTREMQVAGVAAVFGLYPVVREKKYDEMQGLLKKRGGLSYAERQRFDVAHPEVGLFLASLRIKQR